MLYSTYEIVKFKPTLVKKSPKLQHKPFLNANNESRKNVAEGDFIVLWVWTGWMDERKSQLCYDSRDNKT